MREENKIDKKKLEELTGGILSNIVHLAVSSIGVMEEKGKIPEKIIDKNGVEHTINHEKIKEVVKKFGRNREERKNNDSESPLAGWKRKHCKHKKTKEKNFKRIKNDQKEEKN